MSQAERQLLAARAVRDAAKASFESRTDLVKGDVEARGVGGRITERLGEEARKGLDQAIEVAGDSKLIVAALLGALAVWFLRHPIIAWIEERIDELQDREEETDDD